VTTEKYVHHGQVVSVQPSLKGKHREHCLCHGCANFKPGRVDNCEIAEATFKNCQQFGTVTPVYECPKFKAAEKRAQPDVIDSAITRIDAVTASLRAAIH
jgi:hypothetical protein